MECLPPSDSLNAAANGLSIPRRIATTSPPFSDEGATASRDVFEEILIIP